MILRMNITCVFFGKNIRKVQKSWTKHDGGVHDIDNKTNMALEDLRVALVWFLPEEILYVII